MVVVDDALLLTVLAGVAPARLDDEIRRDELFTTASWYYRLSRAAHDRTRTGALSTVVATIAPERRRAFFAALDELPPPVGMLSLRHVVPVMTQLPVNRSLNFLTAEAVAVARMLSGRIEVTVDSPLLRDACRQLGVTLEVVEP
jgi:hypothetical protein